MLKKAQWINQIKSNLKDGDDDVNIIVISSYQVQYLIEIHPVNRFNILEHLICDLEVLLPDIRLQSITWLFGEKSFFL